MLYIFPAWLFILKRFILNPRHSGTFFSQVSGLQGRCGILADCVIPNPGACSRSAPGRRLGPREARLFQVGSQPVRTSHGNMISLLTSLNENVCHRVFLCSQCLPLLDNPAFHGLSRMPCVHPAGGHSGGLWASSASWTCGLHVQSPVGVIPSPLPFSISQSHRNTN